MKNNNFDEKYNLKIMIECIDDISSRLNGAYNLILPLETKFDAEGILKTKKYLKKEADYLKIFSGYHDKNVSDFLKQGVEKNYQGVIKKYEKSYLILNKFLEELEDNYRRKLN